MPYKVVTPFMHLPIAGSTNAYLSGVPIKEGRLMGMCFKVKMAVCKVPGNNSCCYCNSTPVALCNTGDKDRSLVKCLLAGFVSIFIVFTCVIIFSH